MTRNRLFAALCVALATSGAPAAERPQLDNPAIDMQAYLRVSAQAARHRETRRVSEAEFIRLSRTRGAVVLDARSAEKYRELHVKGAINLSFPDLATASLA